MNKFNVIITGSRHKNTWYADKIGQVFEVNTAVTDTSFWAYSVIGQARSIYHGDASPVRGTAEIKLTRSGEYRFTLKGKNGEVVATSHGETYTRKAKCLQTLKRLFGEFEVIDKTVKKKTK